MGRGSVSSDGLLRLEGDMHDGGIGLGGGIRVRFMAVLE